MNSSDWTRLGQCLQELYAPGLCARNYIERSFAAITRLVAGEFVTYSKASPDRQDAFSVVFSVRDPLPLVHLEAFARLRVRYPLFNYQLDEQGGRPIFLRDYFSTRAFRRTDMFCDVYRRVGLNNHCALPVAGEDGAALFFSIERDGRVDFTERDRAVLAHLKPHLINTRLLAKERTSCDTFGPEHFSHLGLTTREAEVFHWLVEGKRNLEIACILSISGQSAKNYVSSIFNKLGLENRTSAILFGFEAARHVQADELATSPTSLFRFRVKAA